MCLDHPQIISPIPTPNLWKNFFRNLVLGAKKVGDPCCELHPPEDLRDPSPNNLEWPGSALSGPSMRRHNLLHNWALI